MWALHTRNSVCMMQILVPLSLRQEDSGLPAFHSCASEQNTSSQMNILEPEMVVNSTSYIYTTTSRESSHESCQMSCGSGSCWWWLNTCLQKELGASTQWLPWLQMRNHKWTQLENNSDTISLQQYLNNSCGVTLGTATTTTITN